MQANLATVARGKVGFSTVTTPDGTVKLVGGLRGVVERTATRYYLAMDVWLHARKLPASRQLTARLERWFDSTERYARQLHEIDRERYFSMKRREQSPFQPGSWWRCGHW